DRQMPAIFWVTNTADFGAGSFRDALTQANNHFFNPQVPEPVWPNQIRFAINQPGVQTINLNQPLPPVANTVVINGPTQPGAAPNAPMIELNGAGAGGGARGLQLNVPNNQILGLAIENFSGAGVEINTGRNLLVNDFIGTDATGMRAAGNGTGVLIQNAATGN